MRSTVSGLPGRTSRCCSFNRIWSALAEVQEGEERGRREGGREGRGRGRSLIMLVIHGKYILYYILQPMRGFGDVSKYLLHRTHL